MAYRFTDTNKWGDSWFYKLKNLEKLLFIYLCDNCDVAGIIEVNERKWAFDLNAKETEILAAIKGLSRGLIFSKDGDIIYLRNFLKHQKNLPLNPENKAHLGIIKRLEANLNKFDYQSINDYLQAPAKPLERGIGIGIGIGLEEGGMGETKPTLSEIKAKKELDFRQKVFLHKDKYPIDLLNAFCNYWTESGENSTKLRFEMQKVFDIQRRLVTWQNNNKNKFNQPTEQPRKGLMI